WQSKRAIEQLLAARFPKADVPERIARVHEQTTAPGLDGRETSSGAMGPEVVLPRIAAESDGIIPQARELAPLSASSWAVQFTATSALCDKIERARELLSHALPGGELGPLFERALDALIERETKRRLGSGTPRKRRLLKPGSRHVPLDVARLVWQRDG